MAQVRAVTDLVALVSEHTALRQQGRRWVGLCPFHSEKTASFSVNAQEGFYYCFGCSASGDAITFVRATEHLDFAETVRFLADRAGIVLHETEEGSADRKRRSELLDAMTKAVVWYHERLLSAPDAGRARDYLRSRGYDGAIVRRFQLGWAPDDWDALTRALGLSAQVASDSGLGFVNRAGRLQDALRARVLFPIFDPSGRAVAIGGRILPGPPGVEATQGSASRRPEPKYKNSQETPIYSKRRTLYALNWAKHDIIATGEVVVCEGYT
ncbi:MAG: DNA primase, partial [Acidimicrobiales bacterium]